MSHCVRHMEEPAANACGDCAREFCTRCLVYSFGPKKPPMCINCALYAGGVRNGHRPAVPAAARQATSGAPPRDKRAERAYRRAEKDAVKAAQKAVKKAARQGVTPQPATPSVPTAGLKGQVPAPSQLLAGAGADIGYVSRTS